MMPTIEGAAKDEMYDSQRPLSSLNSSSVSINH